MEESRPEGASRSLKAGKERMAIIRRLMLEFAGVTIEELPKKKDDFQDHVRLKFDSEEQAESFMTEMLQLGQQEHLRRGDPPLR